MRLRLLSLAITAVSLGLSGCIPTQYTRVGGTPEQFEKDKAECVRYTEIHPTMAIGTAPLVVSQCLRDKGWSFVR